MGKLRFTSLDVNMEHMHISKDLYIVHIVKFYNVCNISQENFIENMLTWAWSMFLCDFHESLLCQEN